MYVSIKGIEQFKHISTLTLTCTHAHTGIKGVNSAAASRAAAAAVGHAPPSAGKW